MKVSSFLDRGYHWIENLISPSCVRLLEIVYPTGIYLILKLDIEEG